MKKLSALIISVVLLLAVSAAYAENKDGSYTLTPFVGGYFFEGGHSYEDWPEYDYRDKAIYGLRFGYNFTENVGAELLLHYLRGEVDALYDNYFNRYGASIEGLYHFNPGGTVVPFIAAGIGGTHIGNTDKEPGFDEFVVDYGAGVKIFITEDIALRADVRHFLPMSSGHVYNDLLVTFGITFAFEGKKKVAQEARVEEPPPPVREEIVTPPPVAEPPPPSPPPTTTIPTTPPPPPPAVVLPAPNVEQPPAVVYEPEPAKRVETASFILKVQFDKTKKYVVDKKYHKNIKRLADFMKEHPETTIEVIGHTFNSGKEGYDIIFTQKRADSVRKYLIDQFGIEASRIHALGFGSSQPVASNKTKAGRLKNQRIEIVIDNLIVDR